MKYVMSGVRIPLHTGRGHFAANPGGISVARIDFGFI
jgi:hypothetical protein